MSDLIFEHARVIDGTGRPPFRAHVHVRGNRIGSVVESDQAIDVGNKTRRIDCRGKLLMPGLVEPHGHLSFTDGRVVDYTFLPPEESILATVRNAKIALDSGYTSVFSAAAAKPRLDVVLKREILAGRVPGPRYLACSPEVTVIGGLGDTNQLHLPYNQAPNVSWIVNGADEVRRACRMFAREGVDNIKLHLSGDLGPSSAGSVQTPFSEQELAAAAEVADAMGVQLVCHARSSRSVLRALKYGLKVINHANYADEQAIDALEAQKHRVVVIPAIGVTHAFAYADGRWNISRALSEQFEAELEATVETMAKMRKRGIRVLPGGDYGFVCTPHGSYARDLWLFVNVLGFSPMEAIVAATGQAACVMGTNEMLGVIKEGALADILVVDGDPLADIGILQDQSRLSVIVKDGEVYKGHAAPPACRDGV